MSILSNEIYYTSVLWKEDYKLSMFKKILDFRDFSNRFLIKTFFLIMLKLIIFFIYFLQPFLAWLELDISI